MPFLLIRQHLVDPTAAPDGPGSLAGYVALIHGFPSNAWTCARAAALIETTFGLVYTADHVGVLMKELGLSPQKPDKRSMKRDETKIQVWERE